MGFFDPGAALGAIRGLDDVTSITHSKTATRNLLANLLAEVSAEIAACGAPTQILNRLEQVVSRTGSASSLYRSLLENDQLRARLLLALDAGDLFAQRLGQYPELLDFLVTASLDLDGFRRAVAEGLAQLKGQGLAALGRPVQAVQGYRRIQSNRRVAGESVAPDTQPETVADSGHGPRMVGRPCRGRNPARQR